MDGKLAKLYAILGTTFLLFTSLNALDPIFPLYVVDLGFSYFDLGILMAIPSIFSIFLNLPIGTVASRIGRKRIILSSLAIQSSSFLLLGFLSDWGSLLAARILRGIAVVFFSPIIIAAIYDLASPTRRGRMFGLFFTSIGLGTISGPSLSSLLLQCLDLNTFFLVLSLFPGLGFGLYLIGSSDSNPSSVEEHIEIRSIGRVLKNRGVLGLCFCRALFAMTASVFLTVFSIYTRDVLLITPSLVSALFMIRAVFTTLLHVPSGKISDRIGGRKPAMLSYIFVAVVFYLFSETKSLIAFMLIMALYGFAWGLRAVPEVTLLSNLVDKEDGDVGIALLQTMFPIGFLIGPILAGWLALTVSMQTIFNLSSLIIVPAIIILLRIKER